MFSSWVLSLSTHWKSAQATSVPGKTQDELTPSQVPPQMPEPAQAGRPPTGAPLTGTQCPPLAHDSHCPEQAESQQTPSLANPLAHSAGDSAGAPSGFRQLPWTQAPLGQRLPQLPQLSGSDW
jgi:hypothetical protein